MTHTCTLETNKLEKKWTTFFQVVCHCRWVQHNHHIKVIHLTWRWCEYLNDSSILRFISPRLRPVVEAGEDGGEFELSNTVNFRLRWWYKESEEHIFKTKTGRKPFPLQNHNSLQETLSSCRLESSKLLVASLFNVFFTIYMYTASCCKSGFCTDSIYMY